MLIINVPDAEVFNSSNNEFYNVKGQTIALEHSLVSISKWESKWHKPFLYTKDKKTSEEIRDYVRCMTLTQNVNPILYTALTKENVDSIMAYIEDPMTATWFSEKEPKRASREIITSEIIYYWMIALNIPFECQKWHINRLLTLIRVCNEKNAPHKKMSKREQLSRNRALNAARRKATGSKG